MLKNYIFMFILLISGAASAQYLTYPELIGLLNIAHADVKVDDYLVKKGFEYGSTSNEIDLNSYYYQKTIDKDIYTVGISVFKLLGDTVAAELSTNVIRWKYFKQIVSKYGYKQTNTGTEDTGDLWIGYQNKDYHLVMRRWKSNVGTVYFTSIKKMQ